MELIFGVEIWSDLSQSSYLAGRGLRAAGCWPFSVYFSGFDYGTSLISSLIVLTDCHSW